MPSLVIALLTGFFVAATGREQPPPAPAPSQAPPAAVRPTMPRPEVLALPFENLGYPSLSPDGRMIAFTALDETDHSHVYLVPASGGRPVALTFGPWDDRSPRFSWDGQFVAFVSDRSGNADIWSVPLAGGEPLQLTDDPGVDIDPAFSPDGKQIAFASDRSGTFLLYVLGPGGVFPLTAGTGHDTRPVWSPDGNWIAFESNRTGEPHGYIIPSTGGEETRVGTARVPEYAPMWSEDGRTLRLLSSQGQRLLLVSYQLGDETPDPYVAVLHVTADLTRSSPSLSRRGDRLVYLSSDRAGLGAVNFTTGDGGKKITKTYGISRHPSWSADGRRLVFVGDFAGPRDLYVAGVASGRTARLTESEEREADPDWSSSGEIAFVIESPTGSAIWALEPRSGNRMLVVDEPGRNRQPDWSPDGRFIAFVSDREGSDDIWITELGSEDTWRITALPGSETSPTWSPDGKWIAFSSDQGGNATLWKAPVEIGQLVRITDEDAGAHLHPSWNGADSYIAFTRVEGDSSDIFIVQPSGGKPFPYLSSIGTRETHPRWSPDSGFIAYQWSGRDSIMVMEIVDSQLRPPDI